MLDILENITILLVITSGIFAKNREDGIYRSMIATALCYSK